MVKLTLLMQMNANEWGKNSGCVPHRKGKCRSGGFMSHSPIVYPRIEFSRNHFIYMVISD